VLTGLQTGLIDTVAAPPVGAIALQWFTKAGYLTDLPITYVCGTTVISAKAFNRILPEDQEVVREVFARANKTLDETSRSDNEEARKALIGQGVQYVSPTAETLENWEEIAAVASERLITERGYDPSIIAEIQELITTYRAQQNSETAGN
jgi:TRAP-type C4-dicarboxylate transport system substrate-binding protein